MMAKSRNLQFVLYRGAHDGYYCFYQNGDGTFSRITHDGNGKSTKVSFLTLSQVASTIFEAATLGFKIADLKAFSATAAANFHDLIARGFKENVNS